MIVSPALARFCVAGLALCATAAPAQERVAIPLDVAAVVVGGRWSSGSIGGVFRVVVRTGGSEHIVSDAQVDWIADAVGPGEPARIVKSRTAATGSWRLDRPRILRSGKSWRVEFDAVETHST